jgi:hypothetical protein
MQSKYPHLDALKYSNLSQISDYSYEDYTINSLFFDNSLDYISAESSQKNSKAK